MITGHKPILSLLIIKYKTIQIVFKLRKLNGKIYKYTVYIFLSNEYSSLKDKSRGRRVYGLELFFSWNFFMYIHIYF